MKKMTRTMPVLLVLVFSLLFTTASVVSAQDISPTVIPTRTTLRDRTEEKKQERETRRTEKQQDIVKRVETNLSAVVGRMNNLAKKLREHLTKIRTRAQGVAKNRGATIVDVEMHLQLAEADIASAETKITSLQSSISALDTTHPREAAQTFRTGNQDIRKLFHSARQHLVEAMKALRTVAKESRPTIVKPSSFPTESEKAE